MPDKFGWDNNFGNKPAATRHQRAMAKYHVRACALGKFTATTKPDAVQCSSRDYRTFDTREEAEAWAKQQNEARS